MSSLFFIIYDTAPRIKRHRSKPNQKAWFSIMACHLSLRSCLSWISSTLTEFRQRNFVPIVFSSHPEFISGSILHWSLQSNFGKMLKQVQHDWNIVITEIRWIKLRVTREVIYNSVIPYLIRNLSVWCFYNNQHWHIQNYIGVLSYIYESRQKPYSLTPYI